MFVRLFEGGGCDCGDSGMINSSCASMCNSCSGSLTTGEWNVTGFSVSSKELLALETTTPVRSSILGASWSEESRLLRSAFSHQGEWMEWAHSDAV